MMGIKISRVGSLWVFGFWLLAASWLVQASEFSTAAEKKLAAHKDNTLAKGIFRLNCSSPRNQGDTRYIYDIILPVLKQQGIEPEFTFYQGAEALKQLASGKIDADCGRVFDFSEQAGIDVVRVDSSYRYLHFSLWGHTEFPKGQEQDIKGLRVGYMKGNVYPPKVASLLGIKALFPSESFDLLVARLEAGEIDAILAYEAVVNGYAIKYNVKPLERIQHIVSLPVHMFVQKKHSRLAPILSKAISDQTITKAYKPFPKRVVKEIVPKKLVFGCPIPTDSDSFKNVENAYKHVFNRMGYEFEMIPIPAKREEAEMLKGSLDGACGRILTHYYESQKNLIRLKVPVASIPVHVLSLTPESLMNDLSDVVSGSRVAYERGFLSTRMTLNQAAGITLVEVGSAANGIKMLSAGRVDYFIGLPPVIMSALDNISFTTNIYTVATLGSQNYFTYIQKRHAALVSVLNHEIEQYLKDQKKTYLINLTIN